MAFLSVLCLIMLCQDIFFCFLTDSFCIYYGFWFYVFMSFLSVFVSTCVSSACSYSNLFNLVFLPYFIIIPYISVGFLRNKRKGVNPNKMGGGKKFGGVGRGETVIKICLRETTIFNKIKYHRNTILWSQKCNKHDFFDSYVHKFHLVHLLNQFI